VKIAFVTQPGHAVVPPTGSLELWTDQVARRLAARHEVTIYGSQPPSPGSPPDDGIVYRLIRHSRGRRLVRAVRGAWRLLPPTKPFYASLLHPLEYWLKVAADIRRHKHDVVHVYNYSQALRILRPLTSAKLVLHMQCEWLTQLDARMIDRNLQHADLIVGCSDHITNLVRKRFPHHAARCATIYNGVEIDVKRVDGAPARGEEIRLLNVGRVSPEKGLHVLVDALELLVTEYPRIGLTILGEESPVPYEFAVKVSDDDLVKNLARFYGGSYLQHLRDRMSEDVSQRVHFVSRVSHDEALRFYEDADIFVYPSIFESFAIPPVEAMAAGVPVVASRVGGMQETIVDERTGLFVDREDPAALAAALRRLIEDPRLRRSLGDAGSVRAAEMFSWPRIVADVEAAFSAILERPTAAAGRSVELVGLE
jgi:glycosyltransferase involved in cell wall biosynthesis